MSQFQDSCTKLRESNIEPQAVVAMAAALRMPALITKAFPAMPQLTQECLYYGKDHIVWDVEYRGYVFQPTSPTKPRSPS